MKKFPRQLTYVLLLTAVMWLMQFILIERLRIENELLRETVMKAISHSGSAVPPPSIVSEETPSFEPQIPSSPASVAYAPVAVPTDTSDWAIYRNINYGFGFKYPSDHTAFSDINQEEGVFVPADARSNVAAIAEDESKVFCGSAGFDYVGTQDQSPCSSPTFLTFEVANVDQSLDWWLENNLESIIPTRAIVSKKSVRFSGKPAIEVIGQVGVGKYKLILVKPGNYFLIIHQDSPSKFLDAVLGTFSFNPSELQ